MAGPACPLPRAPLRFTRTVTAGRFRPSGRPLPASSNGWYARAVCQGAKRHVHTATRRLLRGGTQRAAAQEQEEEKGMYRGREGQWAFLLHRLSGLAILAYLLLHVVSISLFMFGERAYMAVHRTYDLAVFRIGLILIVAGVVYHAFNGLRIIVMDFTGKGVAYQRQMWYAVLAITVLATLYTAYMVFPRILGGY
nr:succinate dehydrogenase, cytochrome b556 subunit [Deinococcus geothermalis]